MDERLQGQATEEAGHREETESYRHLQQLLSEKLEVLDMIADNIDGGLKGSNDDSTFSFFYVNEGLPRMLGYTYDEFMKKSGGSAVGAVYPPDLPAALADCERCFARGPVYSAEYRMEKKDGSLMWVLDTGRKSLDSEGVTRINSILMDITPLKQALFDLEVERERYRVALEHMTEAMCEYDVERDLFTVYRKAEGDERAGSQQVELAQFSQVVCAGTLADAEDGAAFFARCTGRESGSMELRVRHPYDEACWYWVQFSCSVIRDRTGAPVRAIGSLKDVTEEKRRHEALLDRAQRDGLTGLLNQTTVKETIQAQLANCSAHTPQKRALMMVDLDCFKEVNDLNGHAYGDHVLTRTARILEEAAGPDSVVGRIGGDEFLILTPYMHPAGAEALAEGMVRQVREIGVEKCFPITCSIGVAYHNHEEEPFAQFFERVDRALYRAKHSGRDRMCIDCAPGTAP